MSENWVLSAGHCCAGLGSGDIVAGGIDIYFPEGVEQHRTPDKFGHPDYDSATINNDVCLLKVSKGGEILPFHSKKYWTFRLGNYPICLHYQSFRNVKNGTNLIKIPQLFKAEKSNVARRKMITIFTLK